MNMHSLGPYSKLCPSRSCSLGRTAFNHLAHTDATLSRPSLSGLNQPATSRPQHLSAGLALLAKRVKYYVVNQFSFEASSMLRRRDDTRPQRRIASHQGICPETELNTIQQFSSVLYASIMKISRATPPAVNNASGYNRLPGDRHRHS